MKTARTCYRETRVIRISGYKNNSYNNIFFYSYACFLLVKITSEVWLSGGRQRSAKMWSMRRNIYWHVADKKLNNSADFVCEDYVSYLTFC